MSSFESCLVKLKALNLPSECTGILFSKFLGTAIILGSLNLKVPQIKTMLTDASSVLDLSQLTIFFDIHTFLGQCLYSFHLNHPFTSYGEAVIILIQNIIIYAIFAYHCKNSSMIRWIFSLFTIGLSIYCLSDYNVPSNFWQILITSTIPINVLSKLSTVVYIFVSESAGPLHWMTFLLNTLGSLARLYTTIIETQDIFMIVNYFAGFMLNSIILGQIFYYRPTKTKENGKTKEE